MKTNIKIFSILFLYVISFGLNSCVDADPLEVVDYDDFYKDADDADAAILGLYGQFMELSSNVVVLNELRADLMDVTLEASDDLKEISMHAPSESNPWSDVTKFYKVIQTCNDILYNFNKMYHEENRLTEIEYRERYSDVGALRCWVYFQLGLHFGNVPYITEPIETVEDISRYSNRVLGFSELIQELINFMEALPSLEAYEFSKLIQSTIDGYSLSTYFINKKCLLGDLYLYNDEYEKAVQCYRQVLAKDEDLDVAQYLQNRAYRLYGYVWQGGATSWYQILFLRYKEQDFSSFYNAWKDMFATKEQGRDIEAEMIWYMSYDARYAPSYPFNELFYPGGNGNYYLKPSEYAIEDLWGAEKQRNNFPYDARGLSGSYDIIDGQPVIMKYSYLYQNEVNEGNAYSNYGHWYLYRAALLHLRFAEAANRAGYPRLAWALVNDGIAGDAFRYTRINADGGEESYPGDSIRESSYGPGKPYPGDYYFDGRENATPYLRGPWRAGAGVRGRANLPNITMEHITTTQDSILFIEDMIIHEAALELAYEGHRWGDLIRFARRKNKEVAGSGTTFLQNTIQGGKFAHPNNTGAAPDLSSEDKWFLPLYK